MNDQPKVVGLNPNSQAFKMWLWRWGAGVSNEIIKLKWSHSDEPQASVVYPLKTGSRRMSSLSGHMTAVILTAMKQDFQQIQKEKGILPRLSHPTPTLPEATRVWVCWILASGIVSQYLCYFKPPRALINFATAGPRKLFPFVSLCNLAGYLMWYSETGKRNTFKITTAIYPEAWLT